MSTCGRYGILWRNVGRNKGVRNRKTVVLDAEYDDAVKITKQIEKVTGYCIATVGSEVLHEYADSGPLEKEFQGHNGAKDAAGRLQPRRDPQRRRIHQGPTSNIDSLPRDGCLVHFTYGTATSDADNLNRLDTVKEDNAGSPGTTLTSCTNLGLGLTVIQDLEGPDVKLDLYAGLNDFDRVVGTLPVCGRNVRRSARRADTSSRGHEPGLRRVL